MAGTGHDNCEFLIVGSDPGSGRGAQALLAAKYRADVLRWVTVSDQLGGACHMNAAVEAATGTYVLFLDDSLEVQSERWLEYLLLYAKMPGVSVVGPRILSPEGNISEAGLVFTGSSTTGYAFRGLKPDSRGYNHFAAVARNCSAVSRRGMLVKRDRFLELGGFDHGNSEEASFDLDFCRRVLEAGDRIVYTPFVVFRSLKPDMDETSGSRANVNGHSGHLSDQRDRFYNINQSLDPERLFCADPHRNNRLLLSDLSSKKLKILSVSHNLDHEGAPLSKLAIDRHLSAQQGVELEVFSPVAGDLVTRYEELHIPIEVKEVDGWNRDYARYVELVEALKYKIAKGRYDLVYANTLQTFWAIQAAQAMNVPSVWNIRESVDYRSYLEHFAKEPRIFEEALAAFAKANRTVFVCQATARLFTPYDKLGTSAVIHNGISLDAVRRWLRVDRRKLRQQLRLPLDKLIVSIIGTVDRRKGQADFVRCANEILQKRQDVEFLIVGAKEDPLVKNSLSEVRRLIGPTQSHIHLVPLVPDALKFYRASDIFVCASYEESFPRVILEAMAFGLPIVSTPVYGIREQIDDEVTGLFFSPGDVGAMTRLVEQLLDNADLRAVLGARARRKVEKAFREERMVDEYCKLFKVVSLECTNVVPGPA
jgi:glycosyltransferase involved in cell wall biosynthesis